MNTNLLYVEGERERKREVVGGGGKFYTFSVLDDCGYPKLA